MRSILLVTGLCSLFVSCGPPITIVDPNDPATDRGAFPGDSCGDETPCLKGFSCIGGVCDTPTCSQSSNPTAWCARTLGQDASLVVCSEQACSLLQLGEGEVCTSSQECASDLSCVHSQCRATCDTDVDCLTGTPRCRAFEDSDGAATRVCVAPELGCSQEPDPDTFCLQQLGVTEGALCLDDVCVLHSPDNLGAACTSDDDCVQSSCEGGICAHTCKEGMTWCSEGFRCVQSDLVCRRTCVESSQCPRGTLCQPLEGEGVKVCEPAPLACKHLGDLEADVYCDRLLRDSAMVWGGLCDREHNKCVELPEEHMWIYVLDVAQDFSLCQRTFPDTMWRAPGTDLTLVGAFPNPSNIFFPGSKEGILVRTVPNPKTPPQPNDFRDPSTFLHAPGRQDANLCPQNIELQKPDWMFSLGCGGGALFRLKDVFGMPAAVEAGDTLVVGAYGPTCSGEDPQTQFADRFLVFGCPRPDGYLTPFESCTLLTPDPIFDTFYWKVPGP